MRKSKTKKMVSVIEIREAIADYMTSEGCGCCRNDSDHEKHAARLAKLLGVRKHKDGYGYNFSKYKSYEY